MKRLLTITALLIFASFCFVVPCFAQNADEPASKDDVILYLQTMHSHDLMQKTMEVQVSAMEQLFRDQIQKEKGSVPPEFDTFFKKSMNDLIKNMPVDQITEAMIPAYQNHFTKGDIAAMNTFYSSPVGQKVLTVLPEVMREGSQAAMPLLSKYLSDWKDSMQKEMKNLGNTTTKSGAASSNN
ncbi:MAG TPA: DUF2059 domain-containing protein [Candidatus Solibacter sp.]|nr:DUF2059 domain-containing protein [Candidatus Solibacter sp.]